MDSRSYLSDVPIDSVQSSRAEALDVEKLSRGLVAGDEVAYRKFYNAYFPRLCRYLFVVTGGNDAAMQEALQATFVRVVKHVKVFHDEATLWSWLTVLARSAVYDASRKHRCYLGFLDGFQRHSETSGLVGGDRPENDPLDGLLEKGLTQLQLEERELLDLKYFAHRSVREIAAQLQVSEKTVESRLTRARRNLREIIKKEAKNDI